MFGNLGMGEILIILVLVLVLFGPKKIPELAHTVGRGLNEFRRQVGEAQRAIIDPGVTNFGTPPAVPDDHTPTYGVPLGGAPRAAEPPPLTPEEELARVPKRLMD